MKKAGRREDLQAEAMLTTKAPTRTELGMFQGKKKMMATVGGQNQVNGYDNSK